MIINVLQQPGAFMRLNDLVSPALRRIQRQFADYRITRLNRK